MPRTQAVALIAVALVLGFVVGFKTGQGTAATAQSGAICPTAPPVAGAAPSTAPTGVAPATTEGAAAKASLPRLVDLGSTTCIPCKQMAPILQELKSEYKGKVDVEFIDVTLNAAAADEYKINVIPTQIFFDKEGKEVSRHEGFFPKAEILAQFEEMGIPTK